MVLERTSLPEEPSLSISPTSSMLITSRLKVVSQPGHKLSERSKKNSAILPLTQLPKRRKPQTAMNAKNHSNSQMDKQSTSTLQDSWPQKLSSSQTSSNKVQNIRVSTP